MQRYLPEKAATVFISTGELSGEMHAAHLVDALQSLRTELNLPPAIVEGNGSSRMRQSGVQLLHDVATWAEMGILANMRKAHFFHGVFQQTLRYILSNSPDMVILVDNRVFNTTLARLLRTNGYAGRIVYYVSPIRWESCFDPAENTRSLTNPRFTSIKRYCDFAIPLFPVSLPVYEELDIPHEYVGNPLCELVKPQLSDEGFAKLTGIRFDQPRRQIIVGAMVGSRISEIKVIGPPIFKALRLINEAFNEPDLPQVNCIGLVAHEELRHHVLRAARQAGLEDLLLLDSKYAYDVMHRADLMIAKSGTGIDESMLAGVPAIMCYKFPPVVAWIAKYIQRFHLPFYSVPNILAGRPVIPELVQEDCTHTRIADLAGSLLFEPGERQAMLDNYAEIKRMICKPKPLERAARILQDMLPRKNER